MWQPRTILARLRHRLDHRAVAHVEGTLKRVRARNLVALRVLDVEHSERSGSSARVHDLDGATSTVWLWWYQAKLGELVICEQPSGAFRDGAVEYGTEDERGVIDRVPRDIVHRYVRAVAPDGEPPSHFLRSPTTPSG